MGKDKVVIDRTVENALLKFMGTLKADASPEDILALYKKMVVEHAILESELLVLRATFFNVLQTEIAKEMEEQAQPPSLRQAVQSYLH